MITARKLCAFGAIVVAAAACTGCGSTSLVDLAAGRWMCAVTDRGAARLGSFDARVDIVRDHKLAISVRQPPEAPRWFKLLSGSWQFRGTSVSVRLTLERVPFGGARSASGTSIKPELRRFGGAAKRTRSIAVFANGVREGEFAVAWKAVDHVMFRQTTSFGSPSAAGRDGDAWFADCKKAEHKA